MKKICTVTILFFLCIGTTLAKDLKTYNQQTGYSAYKKNIQDICKYYYKGKSELIYRMNETESFTDVSTEKLSSTQELTKAKKEYMKNLDSIYACANAATTSKALRFIKEKLIANNANLNARLASKLEKKQKDIEKNIKKLDGECKISSDTNVSNYIKRSVLDQTSYELCRYNFYLDYLYKRAHLVQTNISQAEQEGKTAGVSVKSVVDSIATSKNNIVNEQSTSLRIFPIAYKAYADYENNIGPHIMLELLKEDYIVLREQLHKTINPISLLGYKLKNAMRK